MKERVFKENGRIYEVEKFVMNSRNIKKLAEI